MRKLFLNVVVSCLLALNAVSQSDSALMFPRLLMDDGIFVSYEDFRHNRPIKKSEIVSAENPSHLDFIKKIVSSDEFTVNTGGSPSKLKTRELFAYTQNNALYLNYRGQFFRVTIFGAICYFPALVKVVTPAMYDPRFGYTSGTITTTETRELIMNFYNGDMFLFDFERAKNLVCRDKMLCEEFGQLRHRAQSEQVYRYIRKFNEAHPVYYIK